MNKAMSLVYIAVVFLNCAKIATLKLSTMFIHRIVLHDRGKNRINYPGKSSLVFRHFFSTELVLQVTILTIVHNLGSLFVHLGNINEIG